MGRAAYWLVPLVVLYAAPRALADPPKLPTKYHATVVLTRQAVEDFGIIPLLAEAGSLNLCEFWQAPPLLLDRSSSNKHTLLLVLVHSLALALVHQFDVGDLMH